MVVALDFQDTKFVLAEYFGVSDFDISFYDGDKEIITFSSFNIEIRNKQLKDIKRGKDE